MFTYFIKQIIKLLVIMLLSLNIASSSVLSTNSIYTNLQKSSSVPVAAFWDTTSKYPHNLKGKFSYNSSLTKEEAVRQFLTQLKNKSLGTLYSSSQVFNDKFIHTRKLKDNLDNTDIYHVQQYYKEIPVFGSDISVKINGNNTVLGMNGNMQDIDVSVVPKISAEEAISLAMADCSGNTKLLITPNLTIYINNDAHLLCWQVVLVKFNPQENWNYFIDANNKKIASKFNSITNAKIRNTYSANNEYKDTGDLIISEGGSSTDNIAQKAHDNMGIVYDYFFNTHMIDSFDLNGHIIKTYVHYGYGYFNAYYNSLYDTFTFGDGSNPPSTSLGNALDIVAHEYGHGLTQYTSGLIYEKQSGALNESMSDLWAMMIDRDDWTLGEETGEIIRYIDDPTKGYQPDTMENFLLNPNDNGGVHKNSGIVNKAFYNIIQLTNKEVTEKIYFRASNIYFTCLTDFLGARDGIYLAAQDLYGSSSNEANAVRIGFDRVGIGSVIDDFNGVFYNMPYSTPHPYTASNIYKEKFYVPDAIGLKIKFASFNTESGFDYIHLKDKNGKLCYTYSGQKGNFTSGPVSGDTIYLEFKTDSAYNLYGFDILGVYKIPEETTSIVRFTNISSNQELFDVAYISAQIFVPSMDSYTLFYAKTSDKQIWTTINNQNVLFVNGIIATWNTKTISDDVYSLLLKVNYKQQTVMSISMDIVVNNKSRILNAETNLYYDTIQDALNAASDNQHILLRPGIYKSTGNVGLIWPNVQNLSLMAHYDLGNSTNVILDAEFTTRHIVQNFDVNWTLNNITLRKGKVNNYGSSVFINTTANNKQFYIENCILISNNALDDMGAIYSNQNNSVKISGCLFTKNNSLFSYINVTINNTIIASNNSDYSLINYGNIYIYNSIISNNYLANGSIFYGQSNCKIINSIIRDRSLTIFAVTNLTIINSTIIGWYRIIGNYNKVNAMNSIFYGPLISMSSYSGNVTFNNCALTDETKSRYFNYINPVRGLDNSQFIDITNNKLALITGSIGVNTGSNELWINNNLGITSDLMGNPRIQGSIIDIGAIETDYAVLPTINISSITANTVVNGTVPMIGSAFIDSFNYCVFGYSVSGNEGNFVTLNIFYQPFLNKQMALWNTKTLSNNVYVFSLKAYGTDADMISTNIPLILSRNYACMIAQTSKNYYFIQDALNEVQASQNIWLYPGEYKSGRFNEEGLIGLVWPNIQNVTLMAFPGLGNSNNVILNAESTTRHIVQKYGVRWTLKDINLYNGGNIDYGASIYINTNNDNHFLSLVNCIISGNNSKGSFDGVIYSDYYLNSVSMEGTYLVNNNTSSNGGLLYNLKTIMNKCVLERNKSDNSNFQNGSLNCKNSTFINNTSKYGSFFYKLVSCNIFNSVFINNIGNVFDETNTVIVNSTFVGTSNFIDYPDKVNAINSIFSGPLMSQMYFYRSYVTFNKCVLTDETQSNNFNCVNGIKGFNNSQFVDTANNNYALITSSVGVNIGDNELWLSMCPGITLDIANNPRIQGSVIDIGAYESNTKALATVNITSVTLNLIVNGTVPIIGSESIDNYSYGVIKYYPSGNIAASITINLLNQSAVNKQLGTWNTKALSNNTYILAIYVFDQNGDSISFSIPLVISRSYSCMIAETSKNYYFIQDALNEVQISQNIWLYPGEYKPGRFNEEGFIGLTWPNVQDVTLMAFPTLGNSRNVILNSESVTRHIVQVNSIRWNLKDLTLVRGYSDIGGSIYINTSSDYQNLSIENCIISGNYASNNGGGLYSPYGKPRKINITRSILVNNNAYSYGAILYSLNATINNSIIEKNNSSQSLVFSGSTYCNNSVIRENTVTYGAMFLSGTTVNIVNSIIRNSTTLFGVADLKIVNCTIIGASNLFYSYNKVNAINSIFSDSTINVSSFTNLVTFNNCAITNETQSRNYININTIKGFDSYQFRDLTNNDYCLVSRSVGINVGDNELWLKYSQGVTTDFFGKNRIQGGIIDLGASESSLNAEITLNMTVEMPNQTLEGMITINGSAYVPSFSYAKLYYYREGMPNIIITLSIFTYPFWGNNLYNWDARTLSWDNYFLVLKIFDKNGTSSSYTVPILVSYDNKVIIAETNETFANIQNALNKVSADQHIYLKPNIYKSTGNIGLIWPNIKNVTLMAYPSLGNSRNVIIDAELTTRHIVQNFSVSWNIENLTFCNGKSYIGGSILANNNNTHNLIIRSCIIKDNRASSDGAVMALNTNSKVVIEDSLICNNRANSYGGVFLFGNISLNYSILTGNLATNAGSVAYSSNLSISNSTIKNHVGGFDLFYNNSNSRIFVYNSIFNNNSIYIFRNYETKVVNTIFVSNNAAIFLRGKTELINSTFAKNYDQCLYDTSGSKVINCIFTDILNYGYGIFFYSCAFKKDSLIYNNMCNIAPIYGFETDQFVDFSNNIFSLVSGSVAIDGGDSALWNEHTSSYTKDYEGNNRIQGYRIDLGAIETVFFNSKRLPPISIDNFLPAPNPYNPNTGFVHLGFELNQEALCRLYIYAINGDLLYTTQATMGYGYNEFTWNGCDKSGQMVFNGGYYVYLIAEANGKKVKKFTKIAVIR